MKPRAAYRLSVVSIPVGIVLAVLTAFDGSWLLVPEGVLVGAVGAVNLVNARRRGISWNGPKTFRELRALEAQRSRDQSASRGTQR